jgi:hypothetical protein
MSENKNAKTPADDGQPDAWCNGMPAYEGPLSKEQRKPLVQDLDAPLTLNGVPLYTAPPKKQWVSLTDQEVWEAIDDVLEGGGWLDVARALEQAIKRKNA